MNNIDRQTFHEGLNAFTTHKQVWQRIVEHGKPMPITIESIKILHPDFMRGIYVCESFFPPQFV